MKKFFVFLLLIIFISSSYSLKISSEEYINDGIKEEVSVCFYQKLGTYPKFFEYLYDFNGDRSYVLALNDYGYLIYDVIVNDFVIYNYGCSPYAGFDEYTKYFSDPFSFYYVDDNNQIIDIYDNRVIDNYKYNMIRLGSDALKHRLIEKKNNKMVLNSNRDSTETYIENEFYFRNLHYNFPYNEYNSCCFVAISMLLGYYDSLYNDSFVDDIYEVSVLDNYFDPLINGLEDFSESPGTNDYLQDLLISNSFYGLIPFYDPNDGYEYSIYLSAQLLIDYLTDKNISSTISYYSDDFYDVPSYIKNAINNDKPVCCGYNYDINHACIAYGYTDNAICIHKGWYPPSTSLEQYSHTFMNEDYFVACFYLNYGGSITGSNNYQWSHNGCTGYIYYPHVIHCNHEAVAYQSVFNSVYHNVNCCACTSSTQEQHSFVMNGFYNICSKCGYSINMCSHNLSYNGNYNNIYHYMNCSICNQIISEPHNFTYIHGWYNCTVCGYRTQIIFDD